MTFGPDPNADGLADHYRAQVTSARDYWAFGLELHGRTWAAGAHRYGFNGMEEEILQLLFTKLRIYNPSIGVWLSFDPLASHPNQIDKSPYVFAWDSPVKENDPEGGCPWCPVAAALLKESAKGALIGAGIDYGFQVTKNSWNGLEHPFSNNIDYKSVGISALAGAATGGTGPLFGIGGSATRKVLYTELFSAGVSAGESALKQNLDPESDGSIRFNRILTDVVSSTINPLGRFNFFKGIKMPNQYSLLSTALDRMHRLYKQNPKPTRLIRIKEMQSSLLAYKSKNQFYNEVIDASNKTLGEINENLLQSQFTLTQPDPQGYKVAKEDERVKQDNTRLNLPKPIF